MDPGKTLNPVPPSAVLAEALARHRCGDLARAVPLYHQVVSAEPANARALHLLGAACLQRGEPREALQWMEHATALEPSNSALHTDLGEVYRTLGQLGRAADCHRLALRLRPDNADAAYNLGSVLLQQSRPAEAAELFRQALLHRPNFPLAHNNLGNAFRMLGQTGPAFDHFRRAVELNPQLGLAHGNLGQLLLECNRPQEALAHCREAVRLDPRSAAAHNNLGNVLRRLGRLPEAADCYQEAVRLEPNLATAHRNLGEVLFAQDQPDEARRWIMQAVQRQPHSVPLQLRLAALQLETRDLTGAETHARNAVRLEPGNVDARLVLARVHLEHGRLDAAANEYRSALAARPRDPGINCHLADLLLQLNRREEARTCLRIALDSDPDCATALALLATHLRDQLPAADEAAMRRLLGKSNLGDADRAVLGFSLAQVCDARSEHEEAALHLKQANRDESSWRRQTGRTFDAEAHAVFVERLLTVFSPTYFERVRSFGLDSERPVFIVGLPRSGTSLLEQVLASHSRVFGAGELRFARDDFEALGGGADGACEARAFNPLQTIDADTVRRLGRGHLDRLAAFDADAERALDKMPDNYLYLGFLATLFPRARFLHCCRDLRDVAVSCWRTQFRDISWANDFDHIAGRFAQYRRVMAHWRTVLPVPVLDVRYEDMVEDLEGVARQVVTFLGLEWEPGCLEFHRNRRAVRTASLSQVREPIYRHAVGRWRHYQDALRPLFDRLAKVEAERAGG